MIGYLIVVLICNSLPISDAEHKPREMCIHGICPFESIILIQTPPGPRDREKLSQLRDYHKKLRVQGTEASLPEAR